MPKIVDHDARRRELSAAMWRVLNRDGIEAVTVRSVAAEAGLSKATLAHYFDSQNDLLMFALNESSQAAQARLAQMNLSDVALKNVEAAIDDSMPTTPKRRRQAEIWLSVVSRSLGDPDMVANLREFDAGVYGYIEAALKLMKSKKLMASNRNVTLEAKRLHALIDGLSLHTMTDPKALSPADVRTVIKNHLNDLKK